MYFVRHRGRYVSTAVLYNIHAVGHWVRSVQSASTRRHNRYGSIMSDSCPNCPIKDICLRRRVWCEWMSAPTPNPIHRKAIIDRSEIEREASSPTNTRMCCNRSAIWAAPFVAQWLPWPRGKRSGSTKASKKIRLANLPGLRVLRPRAEALHQVWLWRIETAPGNRKVPVKQVARG